MSDLPATRPLSAILPKGQDGGRAFARIIDNLLFHMAQAQASSALLPNDDAGDYAGLDSIFHLRQAGSIGYQYKFFPSPFSSKHRAQIQRSLERAAKMATKSKISKWVLVTPEDMLEPGGAREGDVTWFEALRTKYRPIFEIDHWGHKALQAALQQYAPALCQFYYPQLLPGGYGAKANIHAVRQQYIRCHDRQHCRIQFVGMSVYKQEASKGVALDEIYIPLRLLDHDASPDTDAYGIDRIDPLTLLGRGRRSVVLGDPGCGKTTLVRFLSLVGHHKALQKRAGVRAHDGRLPILVSLRRFADELKQRPNTPLLEFVSSTTMAEYNISEATPELLRTFLAAGEAILFFDGVDELPSIQLKNLVRERIETLLEAYPHNTCIVTSRIVGYDGPARFDQPFAHYRVSPLSLDEIEGFVRDWYVARGDAPRQGEREATNLFEVIKSPDNRPIRDLARNPLLLTIMALVHKVDAVLPDRRVILYQKCTETLLNTWHSWRQGDLLDPPGRSKTEQRNMYRLQALAHWMQDGSDEAQGRAVVTHEAAKKFLTRHIRAHEHDVSTRQEADELAEAFLAFVKNRAGLLVELGDRLYGFVHLTFQEYLCATDIVIEAESGGAPLLWRRIQNIAGQSKWEETLRLLIASLKSAKSRDFILKRLLRQCRGAPTSGRGALLAGCVVDGIDEAELVAPSIAAAELWTARHLRGGELTRLGLRLNAVGQKSPAFVSAMASAVAKLSSRPESEEFVRTALVALASGVDLGEVLKGRLRPQSTSTWVLGQLCDGVVAKNWRPRLELKRRLEAAARSTEESSLPMVLSDPSSNLTAATLTLFSFLVSLDLGAEHALRLMHTGLLAGSPNPARPGPFLDIVSNLMVASPAVHGVMDSQDRELFRRETLAYRPNVRPRTFGTRALKGIPVGFAETIRRTIGRRLPARLFRRAHSATWKSEVEPWGLRKRFWAGLDPVAGAEMSNVLGYRVLDQMLAAFALEPREVWRDLDWCWLPLALEQSRVRQRITGLAPDTDTAYCIRLLAGTLTRSGRGLRRRNPRTPLLDFYDGLADHLRGRGRSLDAAFSVVAEESVIAAIGGPTATASAAFYRRGPLRHWQIEKGD